ncbi:hypothetical protein MFM001_26920 [Mycobacterium sp. MFM001]|uniref:hypothetical protein n=1 Tax=Mycobacterium sp. MFM001 TaxID=2049453 RepID=UPI000DA5D1A6|nr:hypothetical protein MFM001_26920 [Mycobacterium sp. MFM001]
MTAAARLVARIVAVVSAALVMSCASSPQHAAALPPGFPDLNSFTPVVVDDGYFMQLREGTSRLVNFSTPYDIVCNFYGGEQPVTAPSQGIDCNGDFPGMDSYPWPGGVPARPGDCVLGEVQAAGAAYQFHRSAYAGCDGNPPTLPYGGKPLGVGQKLSYQNVTCAVGPDRLVACLDTTSGQHGFVLKPSGSVAF